MNSRLHKIRDTLKESVSGAPLVTFALFCFNQEEYVGDAVRAALAQTYTPLEIIISDDCSSDKTFEIIQQCTQQYSGPHKVVLNQNTVNLGKQGICGHVNHVMALTGGELIVVAAGDDISFPERTAVLVQHWLDKGKVPDSLHSSVYKMSPTGGLGELFKPLGANSASAETIVLHQANILGASHAWTKRVWAAFGDIQPNISNEDKAIGFRSALMGGVLFVDQPLVKYRVGGFSSGENRDLDELTQHVLMRFKRYLPLLLQHRDDMNKAGKSGGALEALLNEAIADHELLIKLQDSKTPLLTLWHNRRYLTKFVVKHAPKYLFPKGFAFYEAIRYRFVRALS